MCNNTTLDLVGSIVLKLQLQDKVFDLLFHVTVLDLPYTMVGLQGLGNIYPVWSINICSVKQTDVAVQTMDTNKDTSNLACSLVKSDSCQTEFLDALKLNQQCAKETKTLQQIAHKLEELFQFVRGSAKHTDVSSSKQIKERVLVN